MDWSWEEVKELWAERLSAEPEPGLWLSAIGRAFVESEAERPRSSPLWVQALGESSVDPEIAAYMRAHMHEVHEYVADVIRRAQEAGGVLPDRDPEAEAWVFISIGLLGTISKRLGGMVDEDFPRISASRRTWLSGKAEP